MNYELLTAYGKAQIEDINANFAALLPYYEEMMGNFAFEVGDLMQLTAEIEAYQLAHPDFIIVVQSGTYYLTNTLD